MKAVIFDMDGLVVDSEGNQFLAFQEVFKPYGVELDIETFKWVGQPSSGTIRRTIERHSINADPDEIFSKRREIYRKIARKNPQPLPGALSLIGALHKTHKIALATNSSKASIDAAIGDLNILDKFDAVVSVEEVGRGKPYPDIFLRILEQLRVSKDECIALEDSQTGVEAASAAGIRCIAVPSKFTRDQDFSKAYRVLNSLEEFDVDSY